MANTNPQKLREKILEISHRLGFEQCGVARSVHLDEDARRLENWLKKGYHGNMNYMENYFELRVNPEKILPGAKSIITLIKNYYPEPLQRADAPQVAKYAYGKDYHTVIRRQLEEFLFDLRSFAGDFAGRGFVDSAPVLERTWAVKSGIGWVGKNGNLIHPKKGSFFFIACLIVDLEVEPDQAFAKDMCGTCNRCVEACPTQAILPGKIVDGSKCISYFTIELKELLIPSEMEGKFSNWMFGCDTCQDVCPWNRFSKPNNEPAFTPIPELLDMSSLDWDNLTESAFKKIFSQSPLKRSKFKGIQRNLQFLKFPAG